MSMPKGWPLTFDWRIAPKGKRLHAGHDAVAFCGSPRDTTSPGGHYGDKCARCVHLINRRAKAYARSNAR